ncbi:MAG: DUF6624 domain-containing protein [Saprospiraceae bacterium]
MKYILSSILLFLSLGLSAQTNSELSQFIDSLKQEDQKYRNEATRLRNENPSDTLAVKQAYANMRKVDGLVQQEVKKIYAQYGYPGIDLVGKVSSHNFWLLVQHCDTDPEFQETVLASMKIEVDKENASGRDYAYLIDRVKVNTQEKQIYGTQMILNADSTSFMPQPLIDPEQVNERRASVGLGIIEDYIETMNTRYFGVLKGKD